MEIENIPIISIMVRTCERSGVSWLGNVPWGGSVWFGVRHFLLQSRSRDWDNLNTGLIDTSGFMFRLKELPRWFSRMGTRRRGAVFGFDHYCLSRSVSMPPSSDTDDFRRILSGSHEIVVIAGAGLSAGSGEIHPTRHTFLKSTLLHRHTHLSHWKRFMANTRRNQARYPRCFRI